MPRGVRVWAVVVLTGLVCCAMEPFIDRCMAMTKEEAKVAYQGLKCEITSFNEFGFPTCAKCNDLTQLVANYDPSWDEVGFEVVLEAESMLTKTTGGTTSDGWNIWSNGYVEDSVSFPSEAIYEFTITAKGSVAGGVWPEMELRIDQSVKANFTVNTSVWASYTAQVTVPTGSHKVAIAFTNDKKTLTEDRNLYVDKVVIKRAL